MLFSSTTFIYLFLPAVTLIYYAVLRNKRTIQNAFLFLVSLIFYAWGEPKFVFVMMLSIIVNWFMGLVIDKMYIPCELTIHHGRSDHPSRRF